MSTASKVRAESHSDKHARKLTTSDDNRTCCRRPPDAVPPTELHSCSHDDRKLLHNTKADHSTKSFWPSIEYLIRCQRVIPPNLPKVQVLVLDLNGTLAYRKSHKMMRHSAGNVVVRPHLDDFLKFVFRNFHVVIWTTITRKSAETLMQEIFTLGQRRSLKLVWTRENMGLTDKEFCSSTLLVKDLSRLWESNTEVGRSSSELNTILVDDELGNACRQPFNVVHISKWCMDSNHVAENELLQLEKLLALMREEKSVVAYLRNGFRRPRV